MVTITFQGKSFSCNQGEMLLDSLNRQGANVPFGCQAGSCQACLLKAVKGQPSEVSQQGIDSDLQAANYFLPCICQVEGDMVLTLPEPEDNHHSAVVFEKQYLSDSVVRLRTSCPDGFTYRAGQFVNLLQPNSTLVRSYSLASIASDDFLEFHIRLVAGGRMSSWIAESVENGSFILVSDAMGRCCYHSEYRDQPLLLAGTGSGLAPLYGIARQALADGHTAPIYLLHGGLDRSGLYYEDALLALAETHDNFHYQSVVLHGDAAPSGIQGELDVHFQALLPEKNSAQLFLCGDTPMVDRLRDVALAQGIDIRHVHTDAFG